MITDFYGFELYVFLAAGDVLELQLNTRGADL